MRESRKVSATMRGTPTFIAQVNAALPAAPNLCPAMKTTLRMPRQALERRAVEQVAGDALDALRLELRAQRRVGEARHADHAPPGAARLAMRASVGPILPPTPSTRMSPSHAREVGVERRRRRGHEVLERLDVGEALRQRAHARAPAAPSDERPS